MTVIAWDGKMLAADKRAVVGGTIATVTKIRKINGCLIGGAGDFNSVTAMFDWFESGADISKWPECQRDKEKWADIIIVKPDGKIFRYETEALPFEIEDKYFAIGSGKDSALGAMYVGADALTAVNAACQFDCGCGNGVDFITFEQDHGSL